MDKVKNSTYVAGSREAVLGNYYCGPIDTEADLDMRNDPKTGAAYEDQGKVGDSPK